MIEKFLNKLYKIKYPKVSGGDGGGCLKVFDLVKGFSWTNANAHVKSSAKNSLDSVTADKE